MALLLHQSAGGLLGLPMVKMPRGSSSESEASHWTPTLELQRAVHAADQRPITGDNNNDVRPPDALQHVEYAHDALESLQASEGLLGLESDAQRAAAVKALEAVAALAHAQTFQLDARHAVEGWLSSTCTSLPAADKTRLQELAAGMQVDAHESAAVDTSAQGGCSALHRRASVSFYHAFESPGFRGADGVSSPAWVTAELRCHVDFKSANQPDAAAAPAESLSVGIDVEWQAQPLGPARGRHPTVGAKSMPNFLVVHTSSKSGKAAENKVPDADQLQRLQALLGVAGLPPRTFLSFLLLVTLAPGSGGSGGGGGDSSGNSSVAGGHSGGAKRRRVDPPPQAAAVSPPVQRAIQLASSVISEGEMEKQTC